MYSIIKEKNDLILLKEIVTYANKHKIDKPFLDYVLEKLIPKIDGEPLISYGTLEKGIITAVFRPDIEKIIGSANKINEWINININNLLEEYKISDKSNLKGFLFLFCTIHEIEHSIQYLMGKGKIPAPNQFVADGYKEIFELLYPSDYMIPRPIKDTRRLISSILYKIKQHHYVIERNANVETTDILCNCSLYMETYDIYNMFLSLKNKFLKLGYVDSNIGSFEETYRKILMYDKYLKISKELNICEKDRVRYGLNISEVTRKKVLE